MSGSGARQRKAGAKKSDSGDGGKLKLISGSTRDVHARILRTIHELYVDVEDGLDVMSAALGVRDNDSCAPREKITVLLIGNHSAGKSSFINWYIDEMVQKESVAMETSGFTFCTSGKKRDTFKGAATLRYLPFIDGVQEFDGCVDHLTTQVVPSRARNFPIVDFIDSPGLTDGNLKYPFDVNGIIEWLGRRVDVNLIFVFFDPHGQATCHRTLSVVKALNEKLVTRKKLRYILSKADEISTKEERAKVLIQLSQSLAVAAGKSEQTQMYGGEHALDIKAIFRPNLVGERRTDGGDNVDSGDDSDAASGGDDADDEQQKEKKKQQQQQDESKNFNQIDEVCQTIDDEIKNAVQSHCERLQQQCTSLNDTLTRRLEEHAVAEQRNRRLALWSRACVVVAWTIPVVLCFYLLNALGTSLLPHYYTHHQQQLEAGGSDTMDDAAAAGLNPVLDQVLQLVAAVASVVHVLDRTGNRYQLLLALAAVFGTCVAASKVFGRFTAETLTPAQVTDFRRWRRRLRDDLLRKNGEVDRLWSSFLRDATHAED